MHVEEQFADVWTEEGGNNRELEIIKTARNFVILGNGKAIPIQAWTGP
jgi:hypothetical protein